MAAAAAAALLASREGKGRHDIPNFVLLALWGSVAAPHNATTATSKTSTGLPIAVTFSAARPPALSHLSIDCPGLELDHADLSLAPKVLSTDADLVLLRVPINRLAQYDARFSNYFVYRLHSQQAKLDRLPNPDLNFYIDNEIAILRCGDNRYALAVLEPLFEVAFRLHRYLSRLDGKAGSWTSQEVFVKKPLRDTVCPVPDSARRTTYHVTTKVITLGGAGGTVGWVDLWRGILFCDVLKEKPKLHDMPLPLPANGNRSMFLNGCPYYCHDIIVNQSKDTIKYVEMEITQPIMGTSTSDRHSYYEWLCNLRCPQSYCLVPGCWKATIWSMPIPVTSWDDWQYQCSVHSKEIDIPADIRMHYKLLHKFHRDNAGKAMEGTLSLGSLHMAYPTLSIADDDVVYLLSEGTSNSMGAMKMVFAVDVRAGTLQTMVKHDAKRHIGFMRCHVASGISNHLKTSGLQKEGHQEVQEEGAAILQAVGLPLYPRQATLLHW